MVQHLICAENKTFHVQRNSLSGRLKDAAVPSVTTGKKRYLSFTSATAVSEARAFQEKIHVQVKKCFWIRSVTCQGCEVLLLLSYDLYRS